MTALLDQYAQIVGSDNIDRLRQLAAYLKGMKVVHVNSTREGGGVAEILHRLVPLKNELGLNTFWEVITGKTEFYQCTKGMHNALQGNRLDISDPLLREYEQTNRHNFERLRSHLEEADIVFIHDPQPAALLRFCENRRGKWIWRCHIDASHPYRPVWKFLRPYVAEYDASIWSLSSFVQPLPHPLYIIAPSIDPLSDKNVMLEPEELERVCRNHGLDRARPILLQVSRFDRFKDPIGVIEAYRMTKAFGPPVQLVLAGGSASDDPEGEEVLKEVKEAARNDPDIHILVLPPDAHREINALQRVADIVLQKSIREGFGLTVTEAMWKEKPVIGGDAGGICLQVINHHTGFLVKTPEGAALRIRYLLNERQHLEAMGKKASTYVLENFLLTRHLREYLALMVGITMGTTQRIELQG